MCNGSGAAAGTTGAKESIASITSAQPEGRALVQFAKQNLSKNELKDMKFSPTIATFQRTSTGRSFYNVPYQSKKEIEERKASFENAPQHAVRIEQKPGVGAGLGNVSTVQNYKAGEL